MSSVTNDELMRAIKELTVQVQSIASALQAREDRREYHAKYYLKRKADKAKKATEVAQTRLPNTKGSHFCGRRMYNLPTEDWANALKQFADSGRSVFNWLTWLAYMEPEHLCLQPHHKVGRLLSRLHWHHQAKRQRRPAQGPLLAKRPARADAH